MAAGTELEGNAVPRLSISQEGFGISSPDPQEVVRSTRAAVPLTRRLHGIARVSRAPRRESCNRHQRC